MKEQFDRFEAFTTLIVKINRNVRKIKSGEMAEYDLHGAHVSCLYYLYICDGLTAADLCERCEEDKATISRSLDHLEKKGYLLREPDQVKRYKTPLRLTEKGMDVGRRLGEKIDCVLSEIGKVLDEDARMEFYRSLKMISDGLDGIASQL